MARNYEEYMEVMSDMIYGETNSEYDDRMTSTIVSNLTSSNMFYMSPHYDDRHSVFVPKDNYSLTIQSLPVQLKTETDVQHFIENVLKLGKTSAINIITNRNKNGMEYRIADIDFDCWNARIGVDEFRELMNTSEDIGISIVGIVDREKNYKQFQYNYSNGMPMNYIKIKTAEEGFAAKEKALKINRTKAVDKLVLSEDEWNSIYIPIIPNDLSLDGKSLSTEEDWIDYFENKLRLGKISHIDFVERIAIESSTDKMRSAFVHFEYWNDSKSVRFLRSKMNTDKGGFKQVGYYNGIQIVNFYGKDYKTKYLAFKINHKPIPVADGTMNIHQMTALNTALDIKNTEQELLIQKLYAEIESLKEQIAGLNESEPEPQIKVKFPKARSPVPFDDKKTK